MNRSSNNCDIIYFVTKNWRGPSKQNINFRDYLRQLPMEANTACFAEPRSSQITSIMLNR